MRLGSDHAKIIDLVGEGGGLSLYLLETDDGMRFSWNSVWQIPDEGGEEPRKTPGTRAKEYLTVSEAIAGAPGYWIYLMPKFVRDDFRPLFLDLVARRLAGTTMPAERRESCLARWRRACRRADWGYH